MNKKIDQKAFFILLNLKLLLSISLGIFIFILFFQPFEQANSGFNDRLIFNSGFAGIIFLISSITRGVYSKHLLKKQPVIRRNLVYQFLGGFIILTLCSIAFAFYARYVGKINISFIIMFKIILVCLVPPVIIRFYDTLNELKLLNQTLIEEKKSMIVKVEKFENDLLNKTITFPSETNNEKIELTIADIIFIKSADNYVEVTFNDGGLIEKRLIRNSLKNIELQLQPFSNFIRCHRTSIINTHFIVKLNKSLNNYSLKIRNYDYTVPVSRQYLAKIKEIVKPSR